MEDDTNDLGSKVFKRTKEDEKIALSIEYETFLKIIDKNVYMNDANSWVAPLPLVVSSLHLRRKILERYCKKLMQN